MGDEARIREIFNKFDRDGSGEISAQELVEMLREADREAAPERDDEARDKLIKKKASVSRNRHLLGSCVPTHAAPSFPENKSTV